MRAGVDGEGNLPVEWGSTGGGHTPFGARGGRDLKNDRNP